MLEKIFRKPQKPPMQVMISVNGHKCKKEIVEAAHIICSLLTKEELKCLENHIGDRTVTFKDQIIISYHDHYAAFSPKRMREMAKISIKRFKPYFKLKDDDCGINRVLLHRFKNFLFDEKQGLTASFEKRFKEISASELQPCSARDWKDNWSFNKFFFWKKFKIA